MYSKLQWCWQDLDDSGQAKRIGRMRSMGRQRLRSGNRGSEPMVNVTFPSKGAAYSMGTASRLPDVNVFSTSWRVLAMDLMPPGRLGPEPNQHLPPNLSGAAA